MLQRQLQYMFLLLAFCFSIDLLGKRVGSDTAASRQARAFFSKKEKDNIILGFTACDDGITLDDFNATCSYDSYFPLVGDIVLNGGSLWLMRDLIFNSPLNLGVGKIGGNGFSVEFPRSVSNVDVPARNHQYVIELADQVDVGQTINAIDWSWDDKYLAVVTNGSPSNPELHVFFVQDNTLTLTASYDLGTTNVNTVQWRPNSYYLAIGASGGNGLQVFLFTATDANLAMIDSANIGAVNAVAWHPTGNWLAVGKENDNNFFVYTVINGVLGSAVIGNINGKRKVQKNAMDWNVTGAYLAVGYSNHNQKPEVQIFSFDGNNIVENASLDFGFSTDVNAVQWLPNSSLLAFGLGNGVERFQLYAHDASAGILTEQKAARIGEVRTIFGLTWHPDGTFLSTVKSKDRDAHEIEMYVFDPINYSLHLINGYEIDKDVTSIIWSHDGTRLATSAEGESLGIFNVVQRPLTFENVNLFFASDVTVHHEIHIVGDCLINCRGNIFDLQTTSSLIIEPGATLTLEHMKIKGIAGENIRCLDDTGKIILRNIRWIQEDDMQFKKGSIQFKDDVIMQGDALFAYQTKQTSTILSKSKLELDSGFTFSYDPIFVASKNLIEFIDNSSLLMMDGAILHATVTGLQLLNGKIKVTRDSFFASEISRDPVADAGITLGNHASANDIYLEILSGAALIVMQGSLNYCNVNAQSLSMINERSLLKMNAGTMLNVYESLFPGEGVIMFNNAALARLSNKNIMGSINTLNNFNQIILS